MLIVKVHQVGSPSYCCEFKSSQVRLVCGICGSYTLLQFSEIVSCTIFWPIFGPFLTSPTTLKLEFKRTDNETFGKKYFECILQSLCIIKMQKPNHPPDVITLKQVNRKSIEIEVETYLKLPLSFICSTWKFTLKHFFL